ncbi:hypothetical protein Egran_04812 [Elaphomyces granulatus]|uniref:Stress-associated endoplasmic reticulum protein n=1 Tax=Elaphomyces granulatus TaxID=519963 RepID=A0A232LTC4_9EURO|nr:hypothetical protein Egran_04812 [Elaphomyces granulatus]
MVNKVQFTDLARSLLLWQTQTPKQRMANEKFAKHEASKRGKHENIVKSKREVKSPISTGWIVLLAFVICGGLVFELLRLLPQIWSFIVSFYNRW